MANILPSYREFLEGKIQDPNTVDQDQSNSALQTAPIPVVYGLQRVVPPRIFTGISESDPSSLICVYALSEGPCLGIYRLFVDDFYIETDQGMALDNDGSPNGTANTITTPKSGPYQGLAQFEFMSGREYALSLVSAAGRSAILETHISRNRRPDYDQELCYLVCRFIDTGDTPYSGIPKVTVDLFGKQVADAGNPTQTILTYQTDPAAHLQDYLTNSVYGAGLPTSAIDTSSFSAASTFFAGNTDVTTTNGQLLITKRYTSNLVVNTGNSVQQNINEMLKINSMMLPYINGKFTLVLDKAASAEVDVTENSLVESVQVTYPDRTSKYNKVNYTFKDPQRFFQDVTRQWPRTDDDASAFIDEDGGVINAAQLNLNSITDPYMAERIARQYLTKSRESAKYIFRVFKDFFKYQVGDVIRLKTIVPDIDFVEMRVTSMTLLSDYTVRVEAYTHKDEFYWPYNDYYNLPEDYRGPLIPTFGGLAAPKTPDNPISVNPPEPGEENPDQDEPGSPAPPGPPPPPTTYILNNDTVLYGNLLSTIGPNNEYYFGRVDEGFGDVVGIVPDVDTSGSPVLKNAQPGIELIYTSQFTNQRHFGAYGFSPVLTHRNQISNLRIGYVIEKLDGNYGFGLGAKEFKFDPELYDGNIEYFDHGEGRTFGAKFEADADKIPYLSRGSFAGVYQSPSLFAYPTKLYTRGFAPYVGDLSRLFSARDWLAGREPFYNHVMYSVDSNDFTNFYGGAFGGDSPSPTQPYQATTPEKDGTIQFTMKLFEMQATEPYSFIRYIDTLTFTISNSLMTFGFVSQSQGAHDRATRDYQKCVAPF